MPAASAERLTYIKGWQESNPEKVKANKTKYAKSDKGREARKRSKLSTKEREAIDPAYKEHRRQVRKAAWDKNKEKHRDARRFEKYGVTGDQYRAALAAQNGKCWICGFTPDPDKDLSVDHDHLTGRFRGLLCNPCNLGLGNFRDNRDALSMAAKYLEVNGHS